MLCKSPFMIGPLPCACGRCMPCRVNKKRLWTWRNQVESLDHKKSAVATLTYRTSRLPEGGSLNKTHLQLFIKRLRRKISKKIRYFACGEYGETTKRPHFHILLYGLDPLLAGGHDGKGGLVKQTWKYGHTLVDEISPEAIAYVAGYVTKKLNSEERAEKGLAPERLFMSLRPGIGASFSSKIARTLKTPDGLLAVTANGDVPHALRYNGKTVPIGRYIRGRLRKEILGTTETPVKKTIEYWKEMWALRKTGEADPRRKAKTYANYLVDINAQKVLNLEARVKLFAQKHTF